MGMLRVLNFLFGVLLVASGSSWASPAAENSCESLLSERSVFRLTRPEDGAVQRLGKKIVERLVGLSTLLDLYGASQHRVHTPEDFWAVLLETLQIKLDVVGDLNKIPAKGEPLVIVANHPYGFVDGVSLSHLIAQRRDDYMVLGNALLAKIPEIKDRIIPVYILKGSREEKRKTFLLNRQAIKRAEAHLKAGGVLITFPSGAVATSKKVFGGGPAIEQEWQTSVAKIILDTGSSTLPVYFRGKNSVLFHLASRLHSSIREGARVALFPHELLNKRKKTISVVLGAEILREDLLGDAKTVTEKLKNQVMELSRLIPF